jgi:hypothetical protein
MMAAAPVVRVIVPAARAFHQRMVRYLVAEAGVRQFLDIGAGLGASGRTHQLAQSVDPRCRIVYVDSDPVVLSHTRALANSGPEGAVGGLVPITEWRPESGDPRYDQVVPVYGVLARKP